MFDWYTYDVRDVHRDKTGDKATVTSSWKLYGDRDYVMFGLLTNGEVRVAETVGHAPDLRGLPTDKELPYTVMDAAFLTVLSNASDYNGWDGDPICSPDDAARYARYGARYITNGRKLDYTTEPPEDAQWLRIENPDWHSHSWLTTDEFQKVMDAYPEVASSFRCDQSPSPEWYGVLGAMRALEEKGKNPRLVFWFDN